MASSPNPKHIYARVNKKSVKKKHSSPGQDTQTEFMIQDSSNDPIKVGGPLMEVTPLPFENSAAPVDDIFSNLDDYPLEEQIDMIYSSSRKFTPAQKRGSSRHSKEVDYMPPVGSAFDKAFRKWEDKMQKGGWIEKTSTLRSWSDFQLVLGEVNPPNPVIPDRNMEEILKSPSEVSGSMCREIAVNLDKWYLDTVCSQWEVEQLMSETEIGTFCITNPDINGFINLYIRVDPLIHNTTILVHKIGILYRRYKIRESKEYFFSLSSLLAHFCSQSTTLSSDLYLISPQLLTHPCLSPGDRVKLEDYPISLQEKEKIYSRAREIALGASKWLLTVSTTSQVHAKLADDHTINFLIWQCIETGINHLSIYFEQGVTFDCKLRGSQFGFEVQECPIIFPSLTTLLSYLTLFTSKGYLPCNLRYPKIDPSLPPNLHAQNLFNRLKIEYYLTTNKDIWYYEVTSESAITSMLCYRHVGSFTVTVSDSINYTLSIKNSIHSILHFPIVKSSSDYTLKLGTFIDTHYSLPALLANSLQLIRLQQRMECAVVVKDVTYPFAFSFDTKRHKLLSQITYQKESLRTHLKETRSIWYQNCDPPSDIKTIFLSPLAINGTFVIYSSDSIPFLTVYFLLEKYPEIHIGECLIENTTTGAVLSGAEPTCTDLIELVIYCCLHKHQVLPLKLVPPFTTR
ncbi:hypothetical protein LOD99_4319 [Oopsacas minuta]|uniref:SH2 domain-containing protein n=1 Tax=Oopsacas minuta TaxID=111878 RepID=A0AAV7JVB0_9METZ|nr:hypothetical protein LOD99_4319 [Oopsacas minuta]